MPLQCFDMTMHLNQYIITYLLTYPFFGVRDSATAFSKPRNTTTHFQNELKETLPITMREINTELRLLVELSRYDAVMFRC